MVDGGAGPTGLMGERPVAVAQVGHEAVVRLGREPRSELDEARSSPRCAHTTAWKRCPTATATGRRWRSARSTRRRVFPPRGIEQPPPSKSSAAVGSVPPCPTPPSCRSGSDVTTGSRWSPGPGRGCWPTSGGRWDGGRRGPVDHLLPGLAAGADAPARRRPGWTRALKDADLVVVENLCTIPLNLPAARAVAAWLHGRPAVLHHHDPPSQRAQSWRTSRSCRPRTRRGAT